MGQITEYLIVEHSDDSGTMPVSGFFEYLDIHGSPRRAKYDVGDYILRAALSRREREVNEQLEQFVMTKVLIDGVEYAPKPKPIYPPPNDIGATHWAVLPDESINYYKIGDEVLMWFSLTKVWDSPGLAPYTLHSFDDYES